MNTMSSKNATAMREEIIQMQRYVSQCQPPRDPLVEKLLTDLNHVRADLEQLMITE